MVSPGDTRFLGIPTASTLPMRVLISRPTTVVVIGPGGSGSVIPTEVMVMATRIDPFREMDRVFSNALGHMMSPTRSNAMPIDLYRDGDTFVLDMDLPGADPSSIDVDVEDQTLTIRAERRPEEGQDIQWLARERPTGTFARQLMLGSGVSVDKINASYADGILSLRIPVAEEAKPRKIEVAHSSKQSTIEQAD